MSAICWVRRDLRLHDHAALSFATEQADQVHLVFVFDPHILNKLSDKADRRVTFIMEALQEMKHVTILHGDPLEEIPRFAQKVGAKLVTANRDYEPYAKKRDDLVGKKLQSMGVEFKQFKDAVIFEKKEVLTGGGEVYKVFTPYKNKWLETLEAQDRQVPNYVVDLKKIVKQSHVPDVHEHIGFVKTPAVLTGGTTPALKLLKAFSSRMKDYAEARNIPSIDGTSNLSPYIRHGCLSIRDMVRSALEQRSDGAQTWLSELVWRDFYQVILDVFPHVEKESFKRQYDQIKWRGSAENFTAWCEGRTGYPLVDAAMRCLNQTGMMHNRLRMVTASFLCKTLLIDWRKGERYFAEKLLDYDLAANNGGWQWSSSTGCDAQPYFRIFNPYSQSEKFDPEGIFIRAWCPELSELADDDIHCPTPLLAPDYPQPIVSYEKMRAEALQMYAVVKG